MVKDIERRAFIDALRGLAILGVLLVHSFESVAPTNSTLNSFMHLGARGVQLFYVVSAWTLCSSWDFRKSSEVLPVRNFFLRRFFRIAPMFYLAILFYIALYGFSPTHNAPNGIKWWFVPLTALFLHGFHPETIDSLVPGGWSVAVEMSFYLVLPFILSHFASIRSCLLLLMFSVVLYAANKLTVVKCLSGFYPTDQQYLVSNFAVWNFLGQLPVFIMGVLAYFACKNEKLHKQLAFFGRILFLLSPLLVATLVVTMPLSIVIRFLGHHFVAGGLFALLVIVLAQIPFRAIVNPVLTELGKISFGMYLTHTAVLEMYSRIGFTSLFKEGDISSVLHFLCVLIATACVSFLFHKFVEDPGVSLGKRLINRFEQKALPAKPDHDKTNRVLAIKE